MSQNTPGIYYALAYWISATVFLVLMRGKQNTRKFCTVSLFFLAAICTFMQATANADSWKFLLCMLVVFCLKDNAVTQAPFGAPELIAGLAVVGLQAWKRNSLASILGGTALYMVLVQAVF